MQIAKFLGALLASYFVSAAPLIAQTRGMSEAQIDALAERAMQVFSIPGMSVGVIKDGKVVHAKGYGVRAVGESGGIDTHTLYPIASMSKTFTAGALAVLVDEGKLRWDDKVIDHLPEFRLADAWETREVSIRDILSHRLGLSPGAGGLMFYASADFSRSELVHNLQYFRQTSPFRAKFVYDNLAFVVAGEVVARIAGESYEDFVDEHVLKPAGMSECTANTSRLAGVDNIARPHAEVDGKVAQIRKLVPVTQAASYAAAGGLYCNLDGMLRYVQMHLAGGVVVGGGRLFSAQQHEEMWTPQTLGHVSARDRDWDGAHFATYGLGWQVTDIHGYEVFSHAGGLPGIRVFIELIPELHLGTVVLTNQETRDAMDAVTAQIVKSYMPVARVDWVSKYADARKEELARISALDRETRQRLLRSERASLPLKTYTGTYRDPWFGDVTIKEEAGGLMLRAARAPLLTAKLEPVTGDVFIARWGDRSLDADAYVDFTIGLDGTPEELRLKPVSAGTSLIYDFHDLNLRRVTAVAP